MSVTPCRVRPKPATLARHDGTPALNRTTIKEPLPAITTTSPKIQPWSGVF